MKTIVKITVPVLFLWLMNTLSCFGQTPLKELVQVRDANRKELIGYGLVTGLDRTGDRSMSRSGAAFTVQSIANMLKNFGINVDPDRLRTRNVAAVMVTAKISPYHAPGSEIDVTVSSLGDASSLQGGVLLQTPLLNPNTKKVYANAQGPLVTGGINAETTGARVSRNLTLTGTIPGGGTVVFNDAYTPSREKPLGLILRQPSYTNAQRIADAINKKFEGDVAEVRNAGMVQVAWPDKFQDTGDLNLFTSLVMDVDINVDTPARVVINERTGTIVAGGDVVIGEVLISHGNIQIQTQVTPFISQPPPLSGGKTIKGSVTSVGVTEEAAQNLVIKPDTKVTDLATSLNNLGLSPRDIISIFQAIDRAGALKGKLIIM